MKLFNNDHVFKHDWNTVVPHVIRIDTIDRQVDPVQRQYRALRLFSLQYSIPSWVQAIPSTGYGLEEIVCDLNTKSLILKSTNITFSKFFQVEEICEYRPHPKNPEHWTSYTQTASYKISGFGCLSKVLENAVVQSAGEKAKKGLEAMQTVIHKLETSDWGKACTETMQNLEQKWIGSKVGKTVLDAKSKMEETVRRTTSCEDKSETTR